MKIKVVHEYVGAPSGYQTIKEGVYDIGSGELFGLGDYLITNGNAVPATVEDENKKVVELTPDELAIATGQKTDPVVADRHDVLDSLELDNVLRGNPAPNNRQFTAVLNNRAVGEAARAQKLADAEALAGDLGDVAANAAVANAEAARNAAGDNNAAAAAADEQSQADLEAAVERAGDEVVDPKVAPTRKNK